MALSLGRGAPALAAGPAGLRPGPPAAGAALSRGRRAAERHRPRHPRAGGRHAAPWREIAAELGARYQTDVTADVTEYLSHLAERELIQ